MRYINRHYLSIYLSSLGPSDDGVPCPFNNPTSNSWPYRPRASAVQTLHRPLSRQTPWQILGTPPNERVAARSWLPWAVFAIIAMACAMTSLTSLMPSISQCKSDTWPEDLRLSWVIVPSQHVVYTHRLTSCITQSASSSSSSSPAAARDAHWLQVSVSPSASVAETGETINAASSNCDSLADPTTTPISMQIVFHDDRQTDRRTDS